MDKEAGKTLVKVYFLQWKDTDTTEQNRIAQPL